MNNLSPPLRHLRGPSPCDRCRFAERKRNLLACEAFSMHSKAKLSTYRDDIGSGRLRIVVQLVVPGWLGFSSFVRAWGFTVDPDGSAALLGK
jgi:hypothetical protein